MMSCVNIDPETTEPSDRRLVPLSLCANKSFSLLNCFSQEFSYSNGKLTLQGLTLTNANTGRIKAQ